MSSKFLFFNPKEYVLKELTFINFIWKIKVIFSFGYKEMCISASYSVLPWVRLHMLLCYISRFAQSLLNFDYFLKL